MQLLLILLSVLAGFALASFLAVYSYGRFAKASRGASSFSLPTAADDTPLDRLVGKLVDHHPGQSGMVLVSGNLDAFAVRALTARKAGRSLDLQYYIWENGLTGWILVQEILNAADRGVRVRLLLDDINARGFDKAYLALDDHPNIVVRLFNPSRNRQGGIRRGIEMVLRAFTITRRMHNKAWIADGRLAIVGGRNIGDAYFGAASTSNFRDLDLLLLGETVRQTETVFDRFWNSSAAIPIMALAKRRAGSLGRLRQRIRTLLNDERAPRYLERIASNGTIAAMLGDEERLHWTSEAKIVSDPPEKAQGAGQENWMKHAIRPMLLSARTDLEIISPYFIPGEAFTRELVDMAQAGVAVAVLTNSLAATDVAAVHGAYSRCRLPLLLGGIRLFELKPYHHRSVIWLFGSSSASLHTKAFTVDQSLGFIGSMNFDPRSLSLNSEMGVVFEHPALVRQIREIFADETSPEKSYRVLADDGRIVWQDGGQATLRAEPQAGLARRLTATVIRFLPVQSQL